MCIVAGSVLISFCYTYLFSFLAPFIEETVFSPLCILAFFVKDKVSIYLGGALGLRFKLTWTLVVRAFVSQWNIALGLRQPGLGKKSIEALSSPDLCLPLFSGQFLCAFERAKPVPSDDFLSCPTTCKLLTS